MEYFIWSSNSQLLRAQKALHFFIDGTFDIKPYGFTQLICIITNDILTDFPKPLFYILSNNKEQITYEQIYEDLHYLLKTKEELDITLSQITVDYEKGQINALRKAFPKIRLIGCLFHLKQALWRWARSNRLTTKENINETKQIIEKLGSICWKPDEIDNIIEDLQKNYDKTEFEKLISYYSKEYAGYIEEKMIDYTEINQMHRSNSCLESYHNQLQLKINNNPTWVEFIEGIIQDEMDTYLNIKKKERRGEKFSPSVNYGKEYLPNWSEKILNHAEKVNKNKKKGNSKKTKRKSSDNDANKKSKFKKEEYEENFNEKSKENEHSKFKIFGLINTKFKCYLNSILQCLFSMIKFENYFNEITVFQDENIKYKKNLNVLLILKEIAAKIVKIKYSIYLDLFLPMFLTEFMN